jgi:protein-S-isoprenylcysteine O-methyltransferase Ste14
MGDRPPQGAPGSSGSRGEGWVLAQLALLAAIALAPRRLGPLPALYEPFAPAGLLGGAVCLLLGSALGAAAALNLGPNLTPFPRPKADGALVQSGVYAIVRHPIYASVLLLALGWSLLRGSTPALLLTLALALFFDQKARREEAWLLERFPDYADYRRRVHKLIPWIY